MNITAKNIVRQCPELRDMLFVAADFKHRTFGKHFHDHYVIGYNLEGAHDFYFNRNYHTAGTRQIIIIPPGEIHTGEPYKKGRWDYMAIYPEEQALIDLLGKENISNISENFPWVNSPQAEHFFHSSFVHLLAEDVEMFKETLIQFFQSLDFKGSPDDNRRETKNVPVLVNQMEQFLRDEIYAPLKLEDLENTFGYTKYYLIRHFKKYKGLSPIQFHRMLKLSKSLMVLREQGDITSTALELGFYDQAHFSNYFKKYYGFTPNAYLAYYTSKSQLRNPSKHPLNTKFIL